MWCELRCELRYTVSYSGSGSDSDNDVMQGARVLGRMSGMF